MRTILMRQTSVVAKPAMSTPHVVGSQSSWSRPGRRWRGGYSGMIQESTLETRLYSSKSPEGRNGMSPSSSDDALSIENLSTRYCDEFECTSSPAVELTVRALAKDIARGNGVWTKSLLSKNVTYKDSFCSTSGIDSYKVDFFPTYCDASQVTITRIRMIDEAPSSKARIDYTVVGTLRKPGSDGSRRDAGLLKVEVDMSTTVTLNLLTGQIESREDSWKVRSIVGALAWNAARFAWGSLVKSREARKKSSDFIEKSVSSVLGSLDDADDMSNFQADPRDPMKFFQQNDSFKDDAIAFILFVLVLYIIITGYSTLFASGGGGGGF